MGTSLSHPGVDASEHCSKVSLSDIFAGADSPQNSAAIFDREGSLVWDPSKQYNQTMAFSAVNYRGKPHISLWQGQLGFGLGYGYHVLLNNHYEEVAKL
jgi:hypothetical protein